MPFGTQADKNGLSSLSLGERAGVKGYFLIKAFKIMFLGKVKGQRSLFDNPKIF
tara:strand:+ start:406 stop:567 length:162 start_codon:yes stop_codon:yes gene_type:complete